MTKSEIREALELVLTSPNCLDRNMEPANIVDAAYALADAIDELAKAIRGLREGDDDE